MSNRKILLSGGDGELLKGITIARADWDDADNTLIENTVEAPPETGFVDWEQATMSINMVLQTEFGSLSSYNTVGSAVARSTGFARSVLPISGFFDMSRGGVDAVSAGVGIFVCMDNTTAIGTIATEAISTLADLPVGVAVLCSRFSAVDMIMQIYRRAPGDANSTAFAESPNLIAPIGAGSGSARIGFTWEKNKIWAWWEDAGGGGTRTLGNIHDLDPSPWQVGGYDAAGLVLGNDFVSGRPFMHNYFIQR